MTMPLRRSGSLMTLDEWVALPEDSSCRYELQEGVLLVSPRPASQHQQAAYRLARRFDEQLPAGWDFFLDVEVVVRAVHPPIVRVPDLLVTKVGAAGNRLAASDWAHRGRAMLRVQRPPVSCTLPCPSSYALTSPRSSPREVPNLAVTWRRGDGIESVRWADASGRAGEGAGSQGSPVAEGSGRAGDRAGACG